MKFATYPAKALTACGKFSLATVFSFSLLTESALAQRIERGVGCRNNPSENSATGSFTLNILDPGYTFLSLKATGSFFPDGKGGPLIIAYVPLLSTNATGRRKVNPQQQSFALSAEGETLRVVITSRGPRIDREKGTFIRGVVCNPPIDVIPIACNPTTTTTAALISTSASSGQTTTQSNTCPPPPPPPPPPPTPPPPPPTPPPPPPPCTDASCYNQSKLPFASPSALIASATTYSEPQMVQAANGIPQVGKWQGSSWNPSESS